MAGVTTYSCTRCRPVDTEIIEAYLVLTNTSKAVSQQEASRVTAENTRVAAENQRTLVFNQDHGTAVADHGIAAVDHATASADHTAAVADHETASADHTLAVQDHEASVDATSRADSAATAAQHMVDIHTGPAGKSAYEVAVDEGFVGTEEEWLASLKGPVGETPDISIGTVTTVEPGTPAAATMTGTPEAPVLNLSIPKGLVGATPNFTVGTVTTGEPGTPVVVTITGTAAAPVLNVQIPQGLQGNPGSSVDYPFELVNNATTNDATKAATAAVAKGLKDDITQLEHEVDGNLMSSRAKNALLAVFNKVAFAVPDVSAEMTELENALFNLDEIVGIEATYNQGGTVVYDQGVSTLDELGGGLVVKAVYGDGTKITINNYILSGDISTAGTAEITASYTALGNTFTDTFDVVVTHYTAQMVYKMSDSDLGNYKGGLTRKDNNTVFAVWNFGTADSRRVFLMSSGVAALPYSTSTQSTGKYPIPIPRNARKITISISPSATQNVSLGIGHLEDGFYKYTTGAFLSSYENGGIVRQINDTDFDLYRKGGWYLIVGGSPVSSYSGNEPTEVVVTFE